MVTISSPTGMATAASMPAFDQRTASLRMRLPVVVWIRTAASAQDGWLEAVALTKVEISMFDLTEVKTVAASMRYPATKVKIPLTRSASSLAEIPKTSKKPVSAWAIVVESTIWLFLYQMMYAP